MNQILLATDADLVQTVFDRIAARTTNAAGGGGLRSGALDAFESAVAEKLQELRELASDCVRRGFEAVQGTIHSFAAGVEEAASRFGKRAQEFRDRLLAGVREVIRETFDVMLEALRPTLTIGGTEYRMGSVNLEQKLVFSGSLDVSVTSLCKLLGSGELVLKGTYTAAIG